jgi:hypothetical protein
MVSALATSSIQRAETEREAGREYPFYFMSLATVENTLFVFPPIKRTVPMTMTRITASITAYSAISWPSSFDQIPRSFFKIGPPKRHNVVCTLDGKFTAILPSLLFSRRPAPCHSNIAFLADAIERAQSSIAESSLAVSLSIRHRDRITGEMAILSSPTWIPGACGCGAVQ